MNTKEIAKQIRKDLKEQIKGSKFSTTISNYSGGSSITVALMESDESVIKTKSDYIQVNHYYIDESDHLTESGKEMMNKVMNIINKFHWDKSDSQTDYFNCNFYVHLHIGRWDKPFQNVA